jgi:arabinofuranan 3-O-arabinosyltransferase
MKVADAPTTRALGERHRGFELLAFALLAYVPFLLSSPGRVSADTKQYLYLDSDRLLSRAAYLWDSHIGFGTVSHQIIGYLFPMGPYYWLMDHVGVPDWVAQRLWLGSISLAAALGARWLFRMLGVRRSGAIAGALVYMLAPYQLAFTARISVLLLAWAGLPWLVGLAMRAVRRGGWRDPALFALVLLTIGSVNASSLVFVIVGPALWLLLDACRGRAAFGAVLRAVARIAVLCLGVSLWWIVGLRLQGAYGLPILQLTETVRTVAADSTPTEILRGIGNWFFYGKDRLGYSIDQASSYANDVATQIATYAIPVVALALAAIVRWRHRAYFVLLVVGGTVISVGAWPYDDPSPYGALFKWFAGDTAAGLALRNTPRAVPLLMLGLAGLVAAGVSALAPRIGSLWPAAVVGILACAALVPVWAHGYLSDHLDRPEGVPAYWREAIAALQREGDATRVLEIPGSDFAAYRWGDTIEPITPGLMDRAYVARETLPSGSAASVNLLVALDHPLQDSTFEPDALAASARLANIGTIVLRSDLEYERFDTPRPRLLWQQLVGPLARGLDAPRTFGPSTRNRASSSVPAIDSLELAIPASAAHPPRVALFDVKDAVPILHSAPTAQPVVLAGDAEGIVDAAAAGIIDGRSLVLESGALTTKELKTQLRAGADLVLTDSNRRRNQQFFAGVRDNSGYTERAGQDSSTDEFHLDPFPQSSDAGRTVVEQRGGTVDATGYVTPSDRPMKAVDGNPQTAWLVDRDVVGQHLVITADHEQTIDHVMLAQRPVNPTDQSIAQVKLTFDHGDPVAVVLDPSSFGAAGQTIPIAPRTAKRVDIEIQGVNKPTAESNNGVGFTEVGFGDTRVSETVRLPVTVARQVGKAADGHRLDVVLSRLRNDPAARLDEESTLDRRFVLPDARSFLLSGTARVEPNATDTVLDDAFGTTAPGTQYTSSSHLFGDADARASRAFDHDPSTAWTPVLGNQVGAWIDVSMPTSRTVDRMHLTFVADRKHSIPTEVTLLADGQPTRTLPLPHVRRGTEDGTLRTVELGFDPVTAKDLRVQIDSIRPGLANTGPETDPVLLPVSIAEAGMADVPVPAAPAPIDTRCRSDLVTVDGQPFPVEIRGASTAARSGLDVAACSAALPMAAGSNRVQTADGTATGFDVDRVVLSSDTDGQPAPITPAGAPISESGARVRVTSSTADSYHLQVRTDGKPFWLVLGESHSDGWEATADGHSLGSPQLVNGFANGWTVRPDHAGTIDVVLRWTPQRIVWIGLAISGLAVLVCLGLVVVRRRRGAALVDLELFDEPTGTSPAAFAGQAPTLGPLLGAAITAAFATALVSRWWIGLLVGAAVLVASRLARGRLLLAGGAPVALALGALFDVPELGWVAVGLFLGDLVAGWWWARHQSSR